MNMPLSPSCPHSLFSVTPDTKFYKDRLPLGKVCGGSALFVPGWGLPSGTYLYPRCLDILLYQ